MQQVKILKIIDDLKDYGFYSQDIKSARMFQVYVVQQRRFADVFCAITKKQRNRLRKQLSLTPNDFGILICHGRFLNAEMSEDVKHPKLLPWHEYINRLIIHEVHETLKKPVLHTLSLVYDDKNTGHLKEKQKSEFVFVCLAA